MMYAAITDIKQRYNINLLVNMAGIEHGYDADADLSALDDKLNFALKDAGNEIDLYLDRRYHLPLPLIPDILIEACVDLAVFRLPGNAANESNSVSEKAKFWRKELENIANKKKDLPGLPDKTADGDDVMNNDITLTESDDVAFNADNLRGYGL